MKKSNSADASHSAHKSPGVTYGDALKFGLICAGVVLVTTFIVTQAWRNFERLGHVGIYTVATFIIVGGFAALLHRLTPTKDQEEQTFPVLK